MALGYACASGIAVDEVARPQRMWIMALVWPLTALFGSLAVVILYLSYGRSRPKQVGRHEDTPMWAAVAKSACHCGAGCALGDIVAEWPAFALPMVALWFGWHSLFAEKMFAIWLLDFLLAFLLGITFQYFTVQPMRHLSADRALARALKADAASITAWQAGMYGFIAAAQLLWLRPAYGAIAPVDSPIFWFLMQAAMLCGFATAHPVNWLLVRAGVKDADVSLSAWTLRTGAYSRAGSSGGPN